MFSKSRLAGVIVSAVAIVALAAGVAGAQGRSGERRGNAVPRPPAQLHGHVFIGGYFYNPVFGHYPWWPRLLYPYRYVPVFDRRAEVRVEAKPREAAVYVDGFYAGIVDDFDGFFQRLPLTPGEHEVVLFLPGYRTLRQSLYLRPGSTMNMHATLQLLLPGEVSEPPVLAPPVPPPPPGTYRSPRTPARVQPPPAAQPVPAPAAGFGTIDLRVQPAGARVTIDGQAWVSSDGQHFVVEVAAGVHFVEISLEGYRRYAAEVEVFDGQALPLNVSLPKGDAALFSSAQTARDQGR